MIDYTTSPEDINPHVFSDIEVGRYLVRVAQPNEVYQKTTELPNVKINAIGMDGRYEWFGYNEPVFPAHPTGKITFKIQRY